MRHTVNFKVNFFKVVMPDHGQNTFSDVLRFCKQWDDDADKRNHNLLPNIVRLQRLEENANFWTGEMLWIDMTQTALRASREGDIDPVELAQNQGIANRTGFLYDPDLNSLLLESSVPGVTRGRFRKFYGRLERVNGEIELPPILTKDAYENLSDINRVTKFKVKIAGGVSGDVLGNGDTAFSRSMEIAKEMDAPQMELVISVGRAWRNDEINRSTVMSYVKDAIGLSDQNIVSFDSLNLIGRNVDEERKELNFIQEKMQYSTEVEPGPDRTIPYGKRNGAIIEAYEENRPDLYKMYG